MIVARKILELTQPDPGLCDLRDLPVPAVNLRILVVDDNPAIHEDFRKILCSDGLDADLETTEAALFGLSVAPVRHKAFTLDHATQGRQALELVQASVRADQRYALVITDMRMPPGWDGLETAVRLWEADPDLQIVICTAYSDKSWEQMMEKISTPERLLILKKPFDSIEVLQLAHALTEKWGLLQASRRNVAELESTVNTRTAELQAANDGLRISEQRFRKLSAAAPVGIFETDAQGLCTYCNPHLLQTTGLSLEASLGLVWQQVIHPDDASVMAAWQRNCAAGREWSGDYRYVTPSGDLRWVSCHSTPIRSENGALTGFVGCVEDITARKDLELEMARARDAALESARLKSRFMANMSHEIRTPMHGIIGMTELLLETPLNSAQNDCAETIRGSADGLLGVINGILDFALLESGKMTFEEHDLDLRSLLRGALEKFPAQAQARGIEFSARIDPGTPTQLRGDENRLRQVLRILVGNALKFTKKGSIGVHVACLDQDALSAQLRFEIRDTGPGIAPEEKVRLFDPFTQADVSSTRKFGGTGLGLAIARQLLEKMDGAIGVESTPGRGSLFWFSLALKKSDYQEPVTRESAAALTFA